MYYARAIRMLAVLLVAALAISVVPKLVDEPVVEEVAAVDPDDCVKIGWVSEVIMWNPLNMEMVEDIVVCGLMYDSLLAYDMDLSMLEYDLATDLVQTLHANGSVETVITIDTNAYFRGKDDPDDKSHPLTALDVAATYNLIMNNSGGYWDWYLQDYSYFAPIQRAGVWDQVKFWCPFPKATIKDDIAGIPILPMYEGSYWYDVGKKVYDNIDPEVNIGSGMFYFDDWSPGAWYKFAKAPNYYGEVSYPGVREVNVEGVLINVYGNNAAMCTDLNVGAVDCIVLTGDLNAYNSAIGGKLSKVNVIKAAVNEPGITDIAINALPDCFEQQGNYLNRHEALEDPFVRKAIMMTLNKDFIVNDMLDGIPIRAASVVQPGYWQADIEELPYDPPGAKAMLLANGWQDADKDGWLDAGPTAYGVQKGWFDVGTELSGIRCQAIDTDENYKAIALAWPGWADDAGIELIGTYESENTMVNQAWYACDYDIWVWHWGWGPEPMTGALTVWLTSEIEKAGDNCQMPMGPWWAYLDDAYGEENVTTCPYINDTMIDFYDIWDTKTWDGRFSAFDQNITDAMREMDPAKRKVILDKLQQWVYDSYCENPPYYDLGLYAYTDYRYDNWGDWEAHAGLNVNWGLKYLWYMLEPVENKAPILDDPPEDDYTAYTTTDKRFNLTLHDVEGDEIWVNFTFGDGSPVATNHLTGDTTQPTMVEEFYRYPLAGEYTLTVSICDKYYSNLQGKDVWRYIYRESPVSVAPEPNDPVEFTTTISFDPESPAYINDEVECSATFADPDSGTKDTDFKVTWDWDDGTYTVEILDSVPDDEPVTSTVTHTWEIGGTFDVTVNVWDYPGLVSETGEHNVSVTETYVVRSNAAPEVPVIDDIVGRPDVEISCVASSSDEDIESLRFTWEWDDGTYTVENFMPTESGELVESVVTHTWTADGTYPVTVYVEDAYGHNVSDTVDALIGDYPTAPSSITLTWSPSPVFVDVETTFNASATDANGDAITFTVDFGDESSPSSDTTDGGTTDRQYVLLTHTYSEEGTYTVNVTAEDDGGLSKFKLYTITVRGNEPPTLSIQNVYSASYAKPKTITPLEIEDPDEDDVLTVWYNWGDGAVSAGNPAANYSGTHTYMAVGVFMLQVSVNDGAGHNVSKFANVTVTEANTQAVLEDLGVSPNKDEYSIGETITFTVSVNDREGGNVTVTIDFGDGEEDEEVVELAPGTDLELTFTHEYDSAGEFEVVASVDDGELHPDPEPDSKSVTIKVAKAATNWTLILGGLLLAIVIIAAVALLMKKRKGGKDTPTEMAGMEGMALPEEQAPPPP